MPLFSENNVYLGSVVGTRKATLTVLMVLTIALVSFPQIVIVNAQSNTIFIRADGTVEGTDKIIQSQGNIYTFTDDIFGEIKVQRGDCVIDGAGFTLKGNWTNFNPDNYIYSKGIDLSNNRMSEPSRSAITDVTIKNLVITNFLYGIEGVNSYNNTISGCYIVDCARSINMPNNFLITNNTIRSGIVIDYTNADNVITQNNMIPKGEYKDYSSANLVGVLLATQPTVYKNYWSDYNGKDTDGDGIGDTPYIINEDNQDNFPLMDKIEIPLIPPKENLSTDDPLLALTSTIAGFITSPSGILLLIITLVSAGLITFLVITAKRKRNSAEVTT